MQMRIRSLIRKMQLMDIFVAAELKQTIQDCGLDGNGFVTILIPWIAALQFLRLLSRTTRFIRVRQNLISASPNGICVRVAARIIFLYLILRAPVLRLSA